MIPDRSTRLVRAARASRPTRCVRRSLGLALALCAALASAPAPALAASGGGATSQYAWGAASALSSLVYAPVKLCYATLGGVVAGFAYVLSGGDREVFGPIVDASMKGDYVIMPDQLRGERELVFIGRRGDQDDARNVASPPPDGF